MKTVAFLAALCAPIVSSLASEERAAVEAAGAERARRISVEVLSPPSARVNRRKTTPAYLREGVREVRLVDLLKHAAEIVTPAGTRAHAIGSRAGSDVVPGFTPELSVFFPRRSRGPAQMEEARP